MAATSAQFETSRPHPKAVVRDCAFAPHSFLKDLFPRTDRTQYGIIARAISISRDGRRPLEWFQFPDLALEWSMTPQNIRRAFRQIAVPADGKPDPGDELDPVEPLTLPLLEYRGKGRRREYRLLEHNFSKTAVRAPRKLTRKPVKSEGIDDNDDISPNNEGIYDSLPLAAFRAAAPNATNVTLASGRVISLAACIEHAKTCAVLESSFVDNKEDSENKRNSSFVSDSPPGPEKRNSSFVLLAKVNAILLPILGENLAPDTPLWRDVLTALGDALHEDFLDLVRRKAGNFKKNHGVLLPLARQVGAAHKNALAHAEAPHLYEEFRRLWHSGYGPLQILETLRISKATLERLVARVESEDA